MNFVEHIIQSIDEGVQVDVVYTDFCKAFDQVNYKTLLRTMHLFGFSDDLIKLFVSLDVIIDIYQYYILWLV